MSSFWSTIACGMSQCASTIKTGERMAEE